VSLAWGVFAIGTGTFFARSGGGVLETINLIGSAFSGPVLAVFALGVLAPKLVGNAPVVGLAAGLVANLALSRFAPGVSWLWWNPAGFVVTCTVSLLAARVRPQAVPVTWPRQETMWLVSAFLVMLAFLAGTSLIAG
jgi:hypothetical protein